MKFLCFLLVSLCCIVASPYANAAKHDSAKPSKIVKHVDKHKATHEKKAKAQRTTREKAKSVAVHSKKADLGRHTSKRDKYAENRHKSKHTLSAEKKGKTKASRTRKERKSQSFEGRKKGKHRSIAYERAKDKRRSYARTRDRVQTKRSRIERQRFVEQDPFPVYTSKSQTNDEKWLEHAKAAQLAGKASWYGHDFHGGPTASGLRYDMYTFTAAHRTLPLGTVVKVTTKDSGKSVVVCVTDRGPYVNGRIIDLSYAAAEQLGLSKKGVGDVNLEIVCDKNGKPVKKQQAFYVQYKAVQGSEKAGPYKEFADACAMQEAISQVHPDALVIIDSTR